MNEVVALTQWLWAPVVACAISCAFLLKSGSLPPARRIAASAHGSLVAVLYVGALLVHTLEFSQPSLALPFWVGFLLPAASLVLALLWLKPLRPMHWLLSGVVVCAGWVFFVGTMAVTGEWL